MGIQQQLNNVNMEIVVLGALTAMVFALTISGFKGKIIRSTGIIFSFVIVYLGYKQYQLGGIIDTESIKKEDKLTLQHSQDSMQKIQDKRELIDTINYSLR